MNVRTAAASKHLSDDNRQQTTNKQNQGRGERQQTVLSHV